MRPVLKSFVQTNWFLSSTLRLYGEANGGVYAFLPGRIGDSLMLAVSGSNIAMPPAQYSVIHARPRASISPRRGPDPGVGVGYVVHCSDFGSKTPILPSRHRFMIEPPLPAVSMSSV